MSAQQFDQQKCLGDVDAFIKASWLKLKMAKTWLDHQFQLPVNDATQYEAALRAVLEKVLTHLLGK